MSDWEYRLEFAQQLDRQDPLRTFREQFFIPQVEGRPAIYFCGNSLGLQPKNAAAYLEQELEKWRALGVEGHFRGEHPWFSYHHWFKKPLAHLVGAYPDEVVAMNSLTVNLHLLMVSFYRPTPQRYKILCEAGAFPSDYYVIESQLQFHGFDPEEGMVEVFPRAGERILRTEDIVAKIEEVGSQLALVLFPGVQYYTGQYFDLPAITRAAHKVGAVAGFDLAHAVGNVPLRLHDWDVDFAAWCSYKYLNSGPGSVGGAFVHRRWHQQKDLPRFAGWWGYPEEKRFEMKKGFIPMEGVDSWQLSNAPIFSMAVHRAALEIFEAAGIERLRQKSEQLTGFLEFVIRTAVQRNPALEVEIITPSDPQQRGCQLSLFFHRGGQSVIQQLRRSGVIVDWREPNVMRVAPVPLYNTFEEVFRFGTLLEQVEVTEEG